MNLEEVDSLDAIVIIDNELDPLSPAAPDTVQVAGHLGTIAMMSQHNLTDRGGAIKEVRMEDICCSAHGLSILVVSHLPLM
jgi:7,8-dihydropterin-6-yl-methyl-4-(beta-D-ribofuranosyl)aminobenzene 5'-phosphate synthase